MTLDASRAERVLPRLRELGCEPPAWFLGMLASSSLRASFLDRAAAFQDAAEIQDVDCLRGFTTVVFGGSQGLGLDERHGTFPHVTRGRTGAMRAVQPAEGVGIAAPEGLYVSRAYVTRHGTGPLPTDDPALVHHDDKNVENARHGRLRFGHLDVDVRLAAIARDVHDARLIATADFPVSMLVTCMDQMNAVGRYRSHGAWKLDVDRLPLHFADTGRFDTADRSTGPTRQHVTAVQRARPPSDGRHAMTRTALRGRQR